MPSIKVHCAISKKRTHNDYLDLHQWIDAFSKTNGVNHRKERHAFTIKESNYVKKKWGRKGVTEWLFHIALDNLDTCYKEAKIAYSGRNIYNLFKFGFTPESKYIGFNFDTVDTTKFKSEFKDYLADNH
jgi:hypothetical protein